MNSNSPNRRRMQTLISIFAVVVLWSTFGARCHSAESEALRGIVSSDQEPQMEGVLVSAKKVGGTITVTVVTDNRGRYAFPSSRLQPGKYRLHIRAAGYDLDDPGVIDLGANNKVTELNLKLRNTSDLAQQLTNAEWLMSVPGNYEDKKPLLGCVSCHTLYQPLHSKFDAKALADLVHQMRTFAEFSVFVPGELRIVGMRTYNVPKREEDVKFAEYLSSINLSSATEGKWKYELKTLPRPKGRATKVIITEYDLPRRDWQPHDASVDPEGMIWFSDFSSLTLGRLDPRTGSVKEWKMPALKPDVAGGCLDVYLDKTSNPWVIMMHQGAVAKFDRKTEKFTTRSMPSEYYDNNVRLGMVAVAADGMVWIKDSGNLRVFKIDPQSGKVGTYPMPHEFYGMDLDARGNLYLASLAKGVIGDLDAKTGKVITYPTPTPDSGAHRGHMDPEDRFWFAETNAGGKIGMFDTRTKQIREWSIPTPWAGPYDAVRDKNGDVWAGGEFSDRVSRLDPKTGQVTEYLLPSSTNIRRVDVDNSTTPVTFWIGGNHEAKLIRLEPLD